MHTFTRLIDARSETSQRSTLFTLVLAGFAALALTMVIMVVDTSGVASRLGIPSALLYFLAALCASFAVISVHVFVVQAGIATESELLRKEAEAELSESQNRFVSSVSHALRTPLTGITGFGYLMREAAESPDDGFTPEEFIEPIIAETADLSRMIDDLLVSTQIETGVLATAIDDIPLLTTLEAAVRVGAPNGRLTLIESGDARILSDRGHLTHVVKNLVSNAHRHGRTPITIRSRVHGNRCLIEVVDSGPGVSADNEPWLFATLPPGSWRPSLGLGLDVAHRLCESMDADISYRRVRGETIFRVSVPLALSDSRHDQFTSHPTFIRDTLRRMGLIGAPRPVGRGLSLSSNREINR